MLKPAGLGLARGIVHSNPSCVVELILREVASQGSALAGYVEHVRVALIARAEAAALVPGFATPEGTAAGNLLTALQPVVGAAQAAG